MGRADDLPDDSLLKDEAFLNDSGSDSSENEREDRNTIGAVPLEWYSEEEHIGYNREGEKLVKRKATKDRLDNILQRNDTPGLNLRTIYDPYNDEELVLSREELRTLMNIQKGKMPEVSINPYEDHIDWYSSEVDPHPVQNRPEPKRRFVASKWEEQKIVKLVRAIRRGWLVPPDQRPPKKAAEPYLLWNDAEGPAGHRTAAGLTFCAPPKPHLPGVEESYNPPAEYLPSQQEREEYDAKDPEDRPAFLPQAFGSLRHVPQYPAFMHERFERCLDLYLCPRVRKLRRHFRADSLVPKSIPKPSDLRPYPSQLCLKYEGHTSTVRSVSVDPSGQWLLTGGDDGCVSLWESLTGRRHRHWDCGSTPVTQVAFCPSAAVALISAVVGSRVILLPAPVGSPARRAATDTLLEGTAHESEAPALRVRTGHAAGAHRDEMELEEDGGKDGEGQEPGEGPDAVPGVPKGQAALWIRSGAGNAAMVEVVLRFPVRQITWHARGDYFATVSPSGASQSVVVHQVSKGHSQCPFKKTRGRVMCTAFHPAKPLFFVANENNVRVYNLAKQMLTKKLLAGGGVIATVAVHTSGNHVLVGKQDGRCLWFDLDLGGKPYKVLKYHGAAVNEVAYHRMYPLFASGSADGSAHVFHGKVFADLMTNPLIVPVKILNAHKRRNHLGVQSVVFHPSQPWLFTGGSDGAASLFTDG